MTLATLFNNSERCEISFELFPPKTDKGMQNLQDNVQKLLRFNPAFLTCTYGAGGSTQSSTLEVVELVKQISGLPVASHLTCVGSTVEQLNDYLTEAKRRGADYIVALRGDPPQGSDEFQAVDGGLSYANELVELIRRDHADQFGIAVAGYPEVHQEAPNAQTDLDNLKRKVDAGADIIITQLFYDNADFYRFRESCEAAGIRVPIIPGLLPVTNYKQAKRIAGMCKAAIPTEMSTAMSAKDDPDFQFECGVQHARNQTIDLIHNGAPGIHYYVLNKSDAAEQLLSDIDFEKKA